MIKTLLHIAILLLVGSTISFGQTCPLVSESIKKFQAKDIDGAKKSIESASEDPVCALEPGTWYYKAFIFKDHYRTKESKLKDSKSRMIALNAAKKNLELDPKNKFSEECKKIVSFLSVSFYNDAAQDLNDQKFASSYSNYVNYLNNITIATPHKTDTAAIFYAGYTAYMAKNMEEAKSYLSRAHHLKYNDPNLYFYLGKVLWSLGEKDKSLEILNSGLKKYPENREILLTMVNYYLEEGKLKNLETALDKAILLEPKNLDLKITQAIVCEKLLDTENNQASKYFSKAEKLYIQVIKSDSNIFLPNYNLGILYYNKAVSIINATEIDADLPEVNKIQDECVILFRKALPYVIRAHKLNPTKKEALEAMAGIYFALGEYALSNNYKKLAEAIK